MITFKEYLGESVAAIAAANAVAANLKRNKTKAAAPKTKTNTPYQQGKQDKAAGKSYSNPHPFDPKAGADSNYDHNSYRDGYHS